MWLFGEHFDQPRQRKGDSGECAGGYPHCRPRQQATTEQLFHNARIPEAKKEVGNGCARRPVAPKETDREIRQVFARQATCAQLIACRVFAVDVERNCNDIRSFGVH